VSKPAVEHFLELANRADFWVMPTIETYSKNPRVIVKTMDGVEWVLEGASSGRYHVVTRTGTSSGPYWTLASYLFREIADLSVPPGPTIPAGR
jgi:hypothetical protein